MSFWPHLFTMLQWKTDLDFISSLAQGQITWPFMLSLEQPIPLWRSLCFSLQVTFKLITTLFGMKFCKKCSWPLTFRLLWTTFPIKLYFMVKIVLKNQVPLHLYTYRHNDVTLYLCSHVFPDHGYVTYFQETTILKYTALQFYHSL